MHFVLTEKAYELPNEGDAECQVARCFEERGYRVLNNTFSVLSRPRTTKYPEEKQLVTQLFGDPRLKVLDSFCRTVYCCDNAVGVAPGHPDLLVFREDRSEVFFCEVKQGNRDVLTAGEMIGISLIHAFLRCRVEVARVNGRPRSYRWVWPAFQQLPPTSLIELT